MPRTQVDIKHDSQHATVVRVMSIKIANFEISWKSLTDVCAPVSVYAIHKIAQRGFVEPAPENRSNGSMAIIMLHRNIN